MGGSYTLTDTQPGGRTAGSSLGMRTPAVLQQLNRMFGTGSWAGPAAETGTRIPWGKGGGRGGGRS